MTTKAPLKWQELKDRVRYFNKRVLNPFTLSFAGRPHSPYAIIQHIGRRSGREYSTPVLAMPMDDGYMIPLPYGAHVDWCRNILAADGGVLVYQGRAFHVDAPRLVDASVGLRAFPGWIQHLLKRAETEHYLSLKRVSKMVDRDVEYQRDAEYQRIIAAHPGERAVFVVLGAILLFVVIGKILRGLMRRK